MNKIILSLFFITLAFRISAQKVYFIYLQAEPERPFSVVMNGKTFTSSASGYLILSRLRDSTHQFKVRFPGNAWPELKFSVKVNSGDHGYLLKNFGEKGWGLFDLQTLSVQMAEVNEKKPDYAVSNSGVSRFTELLARAVDDSSLKEKPPPPEAAEKKPEVVLQPAEKKVESKLNIPESQVSVQGEQKKELNNPEEKKPATEEKIVIAPPLVKVKEPEPVNTIAYNKSAVKRKSESSTTEGYGMVFIDQYEDGTADTIRIFIPNAKSWIKEVTVPPALEKKTSDKVADSSKIAENKSSGISVKQDTLRQKEESLKPVEPVMAKPVVKNNCRGAADDNDFLELRKRMAAAPDDDGMLEEARQFFKLKCFSTAQIRNLGFLFLNDEGKYRFFDLAYRAVTDMDQFGLLQSEIKDEYYLNRFKSMLRN